MKKLHLAVVSFILVAITFGYVAYNLAMGKIEANKDMAAAQNTTVQTPDNNRLADLIVLNGLFNGNVNSNTRDLAGLIALDRISNNGGTSNLGDLIVLNNLFSGSNMNTRDLAGLIAVDRILGR